MTVRILSNLDTGFADLIHRDLREQGYHVVGFDYYGSITDFIATFKNEAFNLMLLDLGPPVPNQRSILDRILRETDNAPVVLFNALPNDWAKLTSDLEVPIVGPHQDDYSVEFHLALMQKFNRELERLMPHLQDLDPAAPPNWQQLVEPARSVGRYATLLMGSEHCSSEMFANLCRLQIAAQQVLVIAMMDRSPELPDFRAIAADLTAEAAAVPKDNVDVEALEAALQNMQSSMAKSEEITATAETTRTQILADLAALAKRSS